MEKPSDKNTLINYWLDKSKRSIDAAEKEISFGNLDFSANRIYYAAFYAVSAGLISKGLLFKKHSAVRSAFHREFIKKNIIPKEFGLLYDSVLQDREDADYISFISIDENILKQEIKKVKELIKLMEDYVLSKQ